jgi:metal-responsive CopG/Arc/MetJ family transcriptional regulator
MRHDTLPAVTGRSGRGTARQTIRVDQDLWTRFDEAAKRLGVDRSTWLREAVRWCVGEPDAAPPRRPPVE